MAALFVRISEFDPEREEWTQYAQRLTHFFAANGVDNAVKKKEILLAMIGLATFKLTNLVVPEEPGDKTYKELIEELKKHHKPAPSEVIQRLQFYSRDRKPEESVSMYVAELRSLAVYCNFEGTLKKMLRDCLVGGINNNRTRKRLLQEKDLNFQRALEIAQALEVAERDERKLVENTNPEPVQRLQDNKIRPNSRPTRKEDSTPTYPKCYRCGKTNHRAISCRFKSAKCHNCGKTGHLTLDDRCYRSFDSNGRLGKHWPKRPLESTTRKLRTYTGESIGVIGTAQVQVTHGKNSAELQLMVVDMDGPSLLGRNWLNKLTLDWSVLHYLHDGALGEVLKKTFSSVQS